MLNWFPIYRAMFALNKNVFNLHWFKFGSSSFCGCDRVFFRWGFFFFAVSGSRVLPIWHGRARRLFSCWVLFAALFHFPMKVLEHGLLNMPSSSLSPKNTQPISAVGSSCNCCRYQLIANCSSAIPSYFSTFSPVYFLFRSSNTSSSSSLKLGWWLETGLIKIFIQYQKRSTSHPYLAGIHIG